jgi:hypothetical protein
MAAVAGNGCGRTTNGSTIMHYASAYIWLVVAMVLTFGLSDAAKSSDDICSGVHISSACY